MSDFRNMRRDLSKLRELRRRDDWRGIAVEVLSWVIVFGGLFAILWYMKS